MFFGNAKWGVHTPNNGGPNNGGPAFVNAGGVIFNFSLLLFIAGYGAWKSADSEQTLMNYPTLLVRFLLKGFMNWSAVIWLPNLWFGSFLQAILNFLLPTCPEPAAGFLVILGWVMWQHMLCAMLLIGVTFAVPITILQPVWRFLDYVFGGLASNVFHYVPGHVHSIKTCLAGVGFDNLIGNSNGDHSWFVPPFFVVLIVIVMVQSNVPWVRQTLLLKSLFQFMWIICLTCVKFVSADLHEVNNHEKTIVLAVIMMIVFIVVCLNISQEFFFWRWLYKSCESKNVSLGLTSLLLIGLSWYYVARPTHTKSAVTPQWRIGNGNWQNLPTKSHHNWNYERCKDYAVQHNNKIINCNGMVNNEFFKPEKGSWDCDMQNDPAASGQYEGRLVVECFEPYKVGFKPVHGDKSLDTVWGMQMFLTMTLFVVQSLPDNAGQLSLNQLTSMFPSWLFASNAQGSATVATRIMGTPIAAAARAAQAAGVIGAGQPPPGPGGGHHAARNLALGTSIGLCTRCGNNITVGKGGRGNGHRGCSLTGKLKTA